MRDYKWTGEEKNLFDLQPRFKINDKVRIINKDLTLYLNGGNYPYDFAWICDVNLFRENEELGNTYRLKNNYINADAVVNHTIKEGEIKFKDVKFQEDDLELIEEAEPIRGYKASEFSKGMIFVPNIPIIPRLGWVR